MQCAHCGKSDWVTIGNQNYCTHCGNPADANAAAPSPTPVTPPAPVAAANQTPEPSTPPAELPAVPTPPPAPAKPGPIFSDLKPTASALNPANAVHSGPASSSPAVLDLRQITPQPVAPVPVVAETAPTPAPVAATTVPAPASPTAVETETVLTSKKEALLARAATVDKSSMIQKFTPPAASATPPAPPTATTETEPVAPATPVASEATAPVASTDLPNQVVTQVENMKQLAPSAQPDAYQLALSGAAVKPKVTTVMATTLAIALMGGYIWFNNLNNLTVRAAAQKAGISASLPSYLPSSYSLSGPISYGPGYVSLQFKSPSNPNPLVITQRKTSWNSDSLLELFVTPKSQQYVTVQSQGLTIYLYNENQATWVNRGLQYVIEGNTQLNKDRVVKIAESL